MDHNGSSYRPTEGSIRDHRYEVSLTEYKLSCPRSECHGSAQGWGSKVGKCSTALLKLSEAAQSRASQAVGRFQGLET